MSLGQATFNLAFVTRVLFLCPFLFPFFSGIFERCFFPVLEDGRSFHGVTKLFYRQFRSFFFFLCRRCHFFLYRFCRCSSPLIHTGVILFWLCYFCLSLVFISIVLLFPPFRFGGGSPDRYIWSGRATLQFVSLSVLPV